MTNQLFFICLLTGLLCAYCEYYWIQHGYRSLALVASKCPKPSIRMLNSIPSNNNNQTVVQTIFNWFSTIFAQTKDKPVVPTICETFEIHTDPRLTFVLIKTLCLIGLTVKLISSLKMLPTLIRTRPLTKKQSTSLSSMPKGDGISHQSKIFEATNGKIGLTSTINDRRTTIVR